MMALHCCACRSPSIRIRWILAFLLGHSPSQHRLLSQSTVPGSRSCCRTWSSRLWSLGLAVLKRFRCLRRSSQYPICCCCPWPTVSPPLTAFPKLAFLAVSGFCLVVSAPVGDFQTLPCLAVHCIRTGFPASVALAIAVSRRCRLYEFTLCQSHRAYLRQVRSPARPVSGKSGLRQVRSPASPVPGKSRLRCPCRTVTMRRLGPGLRRPSYLNFKFPLILFSLFSL